jgi:hypothetical protein
VDDEYEDVTYELIASTPEREHHNNKGHQAYVGKLRDPVSAELEE